MLVILNHSAGNSASAEDRAGVIRDLFTAHGAEVRILQPDQSSDITALARQAAKSDEKIVIAAGGDGTISVVAGELADSGKILGVLPLGTLNHFAKDLGLPLDLGSAVETIVRGHTDSVDLGEVNGKIFINNSSLGIYPQIVSKREAQEQRLARGKWPAFFWATLVALHRFPFLNLRITLQDQTLTRRTAFVFIGNNEYEIAGFKLGGRSCLGAGCLGLYLTHRTGRFGMFRLAFRALFGRVNQAKDFDAFCVGEAVIESRRSRLLVATDGEVGWMQTPLHYRTRPAALRVLVPSAPEAK
jgi:diacylglycerol kinase family enzyme